MVGHSLADFYYGQKVRIRKELRDGFPYLDGKIGLVIDERAFGGFIHVKLSNYGVMRFRPDELEIDIDISNIPVKEIDWI